MKHIRNIISDNKCALMCIHSPELALEYCDRILLMKDGKIVSDIDVHAASLSEINEKMSLIYDNINVTECTDTKGNVHRICLLYTSYTGFPRSSSIASFFLIALLTDFIYSASFAFFASRKFIIPLNCPS